MKVFSTLFIILNIICFSNYSSVLAASIEEGEKIFTANCAACHAGGNNLIMPDKTLKIEALDAYGMSNIEAITTQVTNGKNAMPSFKGRLNNEDIDNVANYVLSQSKAGWLDED
uniref:Cytochrome c6 n=1 Tax=Ceramothamnion japonicum TaxID=218448 RepID=A0A1C9CDC9_CERJP|nr:cytochrome c553 [Ceramium japonicum]AOM66398.1 cytochrome c553 [Ceramium japonicum]